MPVLHPLPTNVEVGKRHEDGQANEEKANITEPSEADCQSNDPVVDLSETSHVETDGETDYQSNDAEASAGEAVMDNFANRPHRNRQAPQWLTYYALRHAACYRCRVIVTPPTLQPYSSNNFNH